MPKVSVVIPVYNQEVYLKEALDSLVCQTLDDIEIICVNDGSEDSSFKILEEYAQKDSRIKIIDKQNTGYGDSVNRGFDAAKGEYLGILEPDDFVEPDMFETLYNLAKKHNADIAKSNFYGFKNNCSFFKDELRSEIFEEPFCPCEKPSIFLTQPTVWSAVYKREFINSSGIRFLTTPGASYQDTSFSFKVFAQAKSVVLTKRALLHYREDNAFSSINQKDKAFMICAEFDEIEKFLDEHSEKKEKLERIKNYIKYRTYKWNLNRIDDSLKFAFLTKMSEEFKKDYDTIDETLFRKHELHKYLMIKDSLNEYYFKMKIKNAFMPLKELRKHLVSLNIHNGSIRLSVFDKTLINYTIKR